MLFLVEIIAKVKNLGFYIKPSSGYLNKWCCILGNIFDLSFYFLEWNKKVAFSFKTV